MSSSEDEEGNGRAKILVNLLSRSCKELLQAASSNEVPDPQSLKDQGIQM